MTNEEKNQTEQIDIEIEQKLNGEKQLAFGICKAAEVDEDERTVKAVISTGAIDRDGEVLSPKGMKHDNFVKNPVVSWSHNASEPPIGKAIWLYKGRKKIEAKVKFATTDRAEEVYQLYKGGFLNAFSVGFIPLKGHRPSPEEIKKAPELADARFIFDEWELLEFSPVTVPANPEALATAVKTKVVTISDAMQKELRLEVEGDDPEEKDVDVMIPIIDIVEKKVEVCAFYPLTEVEIEV